MFSLLPGAFPSAGEVELSKVAVGLGEHFRTNDDSNATFHGAKDLALAYRQ